MARIERVELLQVDLAPKVVRTDAIQSFVTQETPIVRITCDDGSSGVGYTYTIGTGGSSVMALLRDHLAPRLIGRAAVGDAFEVMVDANQAFTVAEARRRAHAYRDLMLAWLEEPLPAEDLDGHVELAAAATMPIAVGESIYHPAQFREYLQRGACSIVQVDCARIGGITPWLKVAHLAETFNVGVCPHFLMELHVSLTAAVPNGAWVEYIPQLDSITTSRMTMRDGYAVPPEAPGLGIAWNHE